jgi:hypothetical protein
MDNIDYKVLQERFSAVIVALNLSALKYQSDEITYKNGPEVINSREIYLRHVKEYKEYKEKIDKIQYYLHLKK